MDLDLTRFEEKDCTPIVINPCRFIMKLNAKNLERSKFNYFSKFPSGYFQHFVVNGIIPFLAKRGYSCIVSEATLVKNIKQWAWSWYYKMIHPVSSEVTQMIHYHDGSDDEYTWFRSTVTDTELGKLADEWSHQFFLDDSDCGRRQLVDFSNFLWTHINIESSIAMTRYLNYIPYTDSDEDDGFAAGTEHWMDARKHRTDLY